MCVILCLDVGDEVVLCVVCECDCCVFVVEWYGCEYGVEYFFLCEFVVGWYVVE